MGDVNLAYLFALSQFFVAWIIAGLYVRAANNFDRLAKDILDKAENANRGRQVGHVEHSTDHVPGVHRDHAGHYVLGVEAIERARARILRPSRQIKGWQNGIAVAGDYMSAASFLGIAGIIAFQGYDGFMFSVGWLVAYLTVLLVIAEPLRNAGKYTMADVLAYRLKPRPVRAMASLSTLTVSTFYMIAQMVGAGALVKLLLEG